MNTTLKHALAYGSIAVLAYWGSGSEPGEPFKTEVLSRAYSPGGYSHGTDSKGNVTTIYNPQVWTMVVRGLDGEPLPIRCNSQAWGRLASATEVSVTPWHNHFLFIRWVTYHL